MELLVITICLDVLVIDIHLLEVVLQILKLAFMLSVQLLISLSQLSVIIIKRWQSLVSSLDAIHVQGVVRHVGGRIPAVLRVATQVIRLVMLTALDYFQVLIKIT